MARKQLGISPQKAVDVIDKSTFDFGMSTKYSKPQDGIPTDDLADGAVTTEKIDATGTPADYTYLRGDGTWSVLLGNNILIYPAEDYELQVPSGPVDGEMIFYEIRPTVQVTVTIPESLRMTEGLEREFDVPPDQSAFIGIRWSSTAEKWHVLAVTQEVL